MPGSGVKAMVTAGSMDVDPSSGPLSGPLRGPLDGPLSDQLNPAPQNKIEIWDLDVDSPNALRALSTRQASQVSSDSTEPIPCGYCSYEEAVYLISPCGHGVCEDCANTKVCPQPLCHKTITSKKKLDSSEEKRLAELLDVDAATLSHQDRLELLSMVTKDDPSNVISFHLY